MTITRDVIRVASGERSTVALKLPNERRVSFPPPLFARVLVRDNDNKIYHARWIGNLWVFDDTPTGTFFDLYNQYNIQGWCELDDVTVHVPPVYRDGTWTLPGETLRTDALPPFNTRVFIRGIYGDVWTATLDRSGHWFQSPLPYLDQQGHSLHLNPEYIIAWAPVDSVMEYKGGEVLVGGSLDKNAPPVEFSPKEEECYVVRTRGNGVFFVKRERGHWRIQAPTLYHPSGDVIQADAFFLAPDDIVAIVDINTVLPLFEYTGKGHR